MKTALKVLTAALLVASGCYNSMAAPQTIGNCRNGIYHLRNGRDLDIGTSEGSHLRWRRKDGTSGSLTEATDGTWTSTVGWTSRPDGIRVAFPDCGKGAITF